MGTDDKRWLEERLADYVIGQGLPVGVAILLMWSDWEAMLRKPEAELLHLGDRN